MKTGITFRGYILLFLLAVGATLSGPARAAEAGGAPDFSSMTGAQIIEQLQSLQQNGASQDQLLDYASQVVAFVGNRRNNFRTSGTSEVMAQVLEAAFSGQSVDARVAGAALDGLRNGSISSTRRLESAMRGLTGGSGAASGPTGSSGPSEVAVPHTSDDNEDTQFEPVPLRDPGICSSLCPSCECHRPIQTNHQRVRAHVTNEFKKHRVWLTTDYFTDHIVHALALMTSQLTAAAKAQVQGFGMLLDAKHQLETQRMLQGMGAQAHKDYQPSEGLCEIGTNLRSLAASERNADLATHTIAARAMQRQLLSGDTISVEEGESDRRGRLEHFVSDFCNKTDNGNGLDYLCKGSTANPARMNRDIDYTRTVETELTLDLDFTPEDDTDPSDDEEDIFALGANLFAHEVLPGIPSALLANDAGLVRAGSALYLDLRSVAAKRSVAQNSFAALAGMRAAGDTEVQPFLYKLVEELGVPEDELTELLGERPSYFAQMEVLTKKLYQNPVFYTELYDKPANVARKKAALEAIALMQDRDIYHSLLRSEASLAVLLEILLNEEHERVQNQILTLVNQSGTIETLGEGNK